MTSLPTSSTTSHPSSLDLEAFACGEALAKVAGHLGECDACKAFVESLRGALSAGPSKAKAAALVAKVAAAATPATPTTPARPARETARRRWLMTASSVAVPLAAAAALLLFLRTPSTRDAFMPAPPPPAAVPTTATTAEPTAASSTNLVDPDTTFKGGIQVAVIRERGGQQTRFTGTVLVRPGDRLRVEVALDRDQAILAAVLGDDASWLELMSNGVRRSGTHFSERSARIDSSPTRGTILVGSPEAVTRARDTKRVEGVAAVRVDWEGP